MMDRGRGHRRRLHFPVSGEQLFDGAERLASELAGHLISASEIGIDHSQQADCLALLLQFLVDSGMIASENSHTHDGDGNGVSFWQRISRRGGSRKNCNRKMRKEHLLNDLDEAPVQTLRKEGSAS